MLSPRFTNLIRYAIASIKKRAIKENAYALAEAIPIEALNQASSKFEASLSPSILDGMNGRYERGVSIATRGEVMKFADPYLPDQQRLYKVQSSNPYNLPYLVDLDAKTCECPDHWKGHFCKHRVAAHIVEIATQSVSKPFLPTKVVEPQPVVQNKPAPVNTQTYQPAQSQASIPKVELPVQETKPELKKESIIWAAIRREGKILGVEVLSIVGEEATVRALPKIVDGKKLQPQFPFEGKSSTTTLPKKELCHVKVFQ